MSDSTERRKVSVDPWESGNLGRDEKYVERADPAEELALDNALDLQMISIRLPKKLIGALKAIAQENGVAYQPLIRDVLGRFARNELLEILRQKSEIERLERRSHIDVKPKADPPKARPRARKVA